MQLTRCVYNSTITNTLKLCHCIAHQGLHPGTRCDKFIYDSRQCVKNAFCNPRGQKCECYPGFQTNGTACNLRESLIQRSLAVCLAKLHCSLIVTQTASEDLPLAEVMCLVFTRMPLCALPGESLVLYTHAFMCLAR